MPPEQHDNRLAFASAGHVRVGVGYTASERDALRFEFRKAACLAVLTLVDLPSSLEYRMLAACESP